MTVQPTTGARGGPPGAMAGRSLGNNALLTALRLGTRDAHARIEQVPAFARLLAEDLTGDEYIAILQRLHAFHGQIEPAIQAALADWPEAAAMLDGTRPCLLAEDLAWFGAPRQSAPPLPVLDNQPAALGALYVIEGSALGARVIARHLLNSIGVSPGMGGSFFCRQDAEVARRRWQHLVMLLGACDFNVDTSHPSQAWEARMVEAARETFACLERWIRTIRTPAEVLPGSAENDHAKSADNTPEPRVTWARKH